MTGVRPLCRADLPAVAALFDGNARAGGTRPPSPVTDYLSRTLLEAPWFDPETPSLVYERDGAVVGTLGTRVRRMVYDDCPVRTVSLHGLVVHPSARGTGVGRRLMERALAGPQDLMLADTAGAATRALLLGVGWQDIVHASFEWRRVLRPGRAAAASDLVARRPAVVRRTAAVLAGPVDALATALPQARRRLLPVAPDAVAEPLRADDPARESAGTRLRPEYDPALLRAVFDELDSEDTPGRSMRALVRRPDGRVAGWYVAHLRPGGAAEVLQLAGADLGVVLDHLLVQARLAGAVEVRGRVEAGLPPVLRDRGCTYRPGPWVLAHARRPELLAVLATSQALVGRLDGEWWEGYLQWPRDPSGEDHRDPVGRSVPTNGPHGSGTRA